MVNESSDIYGLSSMTKEKIVNLCKKHKLYVTPRLNDVLYLHYQGFTEIKELDEYVGLKCLYLECNAISEISGLENQKELRCLLLHNNVIKKIENLEHCVHLDSINLSHNFITTIENLGSDLLPKLNTLTITNNCLRTEESIANLVHCKTLSVLDLSHNRIDDIVIVKVLGQMPELRVLVLTGNPVINQIPAYRKTLILNCKSLTYLDTRPVFEVDRACAEAWKRGGYEEERNERMRWNQEERRNLISSFHSTIAIGHNESGDSENIFIASIDQEEQLMSNDEQVSDDSSHSVDSCQYNDAPAEHECSNIRLETSGDLNNSDEFQDAECENSCSDVSFLSSLEQFVGNDCPVSSSTEKDASHDDAVNLNNEVVSNENPEMNGAQINSSVLVEEVYEETDVCDEKPFFTEHNEANVGNVEVACGNTDTNELSSTEEIQNAADETVEKSLTASSDNWIDKIDALDEDNSKNSEVYLENRFVVNGTDLRGNSMKITFYCESVDKLMSDSVGDECDDLIQEMTPMVDNFDDSI